MTDLDERLRVAGEAFRHRPVPDVKVRWPQERHWLAPLAVAAAVALVVAGVVIVRSVTHSTQPPAKPAPVLEPDRRFAVVAPTIAFGHGGGVPRLDPQPPQCSSTALRSSAATSPAADGVVGVITLSGRNCRASAKPTTLRLVDSAGKSLPVATAKNVQIRTDFRAEDDGSVRVGFAWTGSYCGNASAAVELTVLGKPLRLPLNGPLPACTGRTDGELVPGSELGPPGAVVPAPAAWTALKAQVVAPKITPEDKTVPLAVVLTNTGKSDISLAAPCATWEATLRIDNDGISTGGGAGGDFCSRALVVKPGQPLRLTVDNLPLNSSAEQLRGATVTLLWGIAGVPAATAKTVVR